MVELCRLIFLGIILLVSQIEVSSFRGSYSKLIALKTPSGAKLTVLRNEIENRESLSVSSLSSSLDRIESVKCAIISALSGSFISFPLTLAFGYFSDKLSPQWEFQADAMAVILLLFGVTYRYTARGNLENPQIKFGVIAAFVITRALSSIDVPSYCVSELDKFLPLDCGPPFHYLAPEMIAQGIKTGSQSLLGFAGAAYGIDYCIKKKFIAE